MNNVKAVFTLDDNGFPVCQLIPEDDPVERHPERRCGRCNGPNVVWCAPSPLWNQVMRGGDINGDELFGGIICPTCFAILCEVAGVGSFWRLSAQRVDVPLQVVTPSGRTWDDQLWMWVDPAWVDSTPGEGTFAGIASGELGPVGLPAVPAWVQSGLQPCACGHWMMHHDVNEYRGDGSEMCCVEGCNQVGCPGKSTQAADLMADWHGQRHD